MECTKTLPRISSPNGDGGGSSAVVCLGGDDLIVESPKVQPNVSPRIEVIGGCDGSTGTVGLADRPVLVESRGSLDRGLVYTCCFIYVV